MLLTPSVYFGRLRGFAVHCFSFQNLLGHLQNRRLGCSEVKVDWLRRSWFGMDQIEFDKECAVVIGLFDLLLDVLLRHRLFHCNVNLSATRHNGEHYPTGNNSARMTLQISRAAKLNVVSEKSVLGLPVRHLLNVKTSLLNSFGCALNPSRTAVTWNF